MFKTLTLYKIDGDYSVSESEAAGLPFSQCMASEATSMGWSPVRNDAFVATFPGGVTLLKVTIERKRVPGDAVRREVEKRCEKILTEEGFKPGRKRRAEIKEEAHDDLIRIAIPARSEAWVWIDDKLRTVGIDAGAATEDVVSLIVRTFPNLRLRMLDVETPPAIAMSQWVTDNETPAEIAFGEEFALSRDVKTARFANCNAFDDDIVQKVKDGWRFDTAELAVGENVSTRIVARGPNFEMKRIRIAESETVEEDVDAFEADVQITTGSLREAVSVLVEAFGGEVAA